jgi:hypothetical protein
VQSKHHYNQDTTIFAGEKPDRRQRHRNPRESGDLVLAGAGLTRSPLSRGFRQGVWIAAGAISNDDFLPAQQSNPPANAMLAGGLLYSA